MVIVETVNGHNEGGKDMTHIHNNVFGRQGRWVCGECGDLVPFGYKTAEQRAREANTLGDGNVVTVLADGTLSI